jgi:putative ABC transport system permease protein
MSNELLAEVAGDVPVAQVFVRADPQQVEEVGKSLDDVTREFAGVEVIPGNFVGQFVGDAIDFMIAAVNGLLGLSVLIALVGIVNTMNLSIHERRRELGMVRALGMLSSQVRNMVRIEGILIGLLGTTVGVASGVIVGWSAVMGLTGTSLSFPVGRIALILGAGVLISLIACLLPARSAVKVPMLEAMAAT